MDSRNAREDGGVALTKTQARVLSAVTPIWRSADSIARAAYVRGWSSRENTMAHCRKLAALGLVEINKDRFWRCRRAIADTSEGKEIPG